jgi:iron complex outermembrane recepter protein
MKQLAYFSLLIFFFLPVKAQEEKTDSTKTLDSVTVRSFEQRTSVRASPVSVSVISIPDNLYSKISLVNGLNQISGVRMEERSPGSYRISIRGSSLRSPFGVRNVKVYWNGVPVTDPGGNTYFNQFAWNNFSWIEVVKGPAGSMYGAGTGGLILTTSMDPSGRWKNGIDLEYITGSYDLQNVFVTARFGKYRPQNLHADKNQLTYSHGQSDGYRTQTKLRRDNFSFVSQVKNSFMELTASVLYTDMYYQTPGALTLSEFTSNPRAARPAAGSFPGAVQAKAAIHQKNLLAGITDEFRIAMNFSNITTLYGSFAQIKNPAIRNYERRNEPSFGARTYFKYGRGFDNDRFDLVAGTELQQGYFNTQVFSNKNGNPDTLQTNDDIDNYNGSVFGQASVYLNNHNSDGGWWMLGGLSLNRTRISIHRLSNSPVTRQARTYRNELAPKISLLKRFNYRFYWLGSVSKGFSPPTVSEVLPSTGIISTDLEAEQGWNYETGLRFFFPGNRLKMELTAFSFTLRDALVQRRDISGADFFVNAGSTKQKGIELHGDYKQPVLASFISKFSIRTDFAYNHFRYGTFIKGVDDFSGKKMPSVPSTTFSLLADVNMLKGFYLRMNYYSASSIYMNDANTVKADPYHLLGTQLGWNSNGIKNHGLNIYAGADNLLNETYSLGNDINAAAGRYYNAAPRRNYYIGMVLKYIKN